MMELLGTAKRHVLGKRPDWVSFNGGVEKLMQHLRSWLGLPQIPELTDLTRLLKQGKRRRGETMNEYITRKTETYTRAQQALGRVLRAHGQDTPGGRALLPGPGQDLLQHALVTRHQGLERQPLVLSLRLELMMGLRTMLMMMMMKENHPTLGRKRIFEVMNNSPTMVGGAMAGATIGGVPHGVPPLGIKNRLIGLWMLQRFFLT